MGAAAKSKMAYVDSQYLKVPRATPECPPSISDAVSTFTSTADYHPEPQLYMRNGLENVAPVRTPGTWSAEAKLTAQTGPTEIQCESHLNVADMPDLRDEWQALGGSPEHFLRKAACRGDVDLCRRALRSVDSIDDADTKGRSPLHHAAENGHTEVVRLLVVAGADVEAKDQLGRTALMYCAWYGHLLSLRYLCRSGRGNVEARCNVGMSALHFAAKYNCESCVVSLVQEFGANVNSVDDAGSTPKQYAEVEALSVARLL